jgi:hypothetical protein
MGLYKTFFRSLFTCRATILFLTLLVGSVASECAFAQGNDDAGAAPKNNTSTDASVGKKTAEVSTGSFVEDPVDQNQKKNMALINSILRAGSFSSGQQTDFDVFYKTFALARWSQLNSLNNLTTYRKEIFRDLRQAKSGQVHDHLNELVLQFMEERAKGIKNYHPAVRYNAMLTIGDLNSVEGTQSTPLDGALTALLAAVNDPNQIEPVKIAALIGINRHVSSGINNPQTQTQVLTTMLKAAAIDDSPEAASPGRDWIRMQAVEILGLLGNVGNNNQVVKVLSDIIGDAKAEFTLRSTAAEALGKLKYANVNGLNAVDLAKTLGQLMLDACNAELKSVKDANMPVSRRRMKARLGSVVEGLKGIKQLAKDQAQQNRLGELQTILDTLLKSLDSTKIESEELQKSVQDCQSKITVWMEK